ncbi:MAG: hypothetical protein QOH63_2140 [Acidobacteriota bacterium]|jgi:hypothetical protein|nr:hypothetical protein [Acidobacteriota bacterium]
MKPSSTKQWCALLVLLIICTAGAYGQGRKAASSSSPSKITGMKVIPYNRSDDTFSDDIANSKEERLNELDLSFLVKIEVSGKAGDYAGHNVEVTVREGSKLILSRVTMLGIFNEKGKYYVPVWIYGPLCQPTTIQATVQGQRPASTIKRTLQFQCGE